MRKGTRFGLALLCLIIIGLRIVFPSFDFDTISLALLVVAAVLVLYSKPETLINHLKSVKVPGLEVELHDASNKINSLKKETEFSYGAKGRLEGVSKDEFLLNKNTSVYKDIFVVSNELISVLQELFLIKFGKQKKVPMDFSRLVDDLSKEEVISSELSDVLHKVWDIREKTIYHHLSILDESHFLTTLDILNDSLAILVNVKNEQGGNPHYVVN